MAVKYSIELTSGGEQTVWRISVKNSGEGTVREVQFPFVSGLARMDSLLMPNHSGQRLRDPTEKLSDEVPVVSLEYPARASMQWFEYGSSRAGLYMASHDRNLEYTTLNFGRPDSTSAAAMWIVKYPFAVAGASWESSDLPVGIHSGDWHWGADRYREWLGTWVHPPDVPKRIREMTGGLGDVFIKGMGEELVHRYEDIVPYARTLPAGGIFLLVGWLYNGHDTFYPEYVPIPDLGGAEAMVSAIDKVHETGRRVAAYMNARLANNDTDTYRKNGKQWAVLTKAAGLGVSSLNFGELHEAWNNEWERSSRGVGWFSVMCPSAKGWQDHLVAESARIIRDYHFDGIFVDQPGSFFSELCYSRHHGHSNPATAWGPGYLEMLRRIRQEMRSATPDSFLWEEGMNDAYGQYLDYHLDKNPLWAPMRSHPDMETFVEMWRYTMPDSIIVNDPWAYSYAPSKDRIYGENYKFVMGVRGVGSLGDQEGKTVETAADRARRVAVAENIERLWRKGAEFFFYGRFLDDVGLKASNPAVFARTYRSGSSLAVAVWNTAGSASNCQITVDLDAAGLKGNAAKAVWLNGGDNVPFQARGRLVTLRTEMAPRAIDAIVIRTGE